MSFVVTGSGGMLGTALTRVLGCGKDEYRPYSHAELDVTDGKEVAARLREDKPDWVIHTAAFTRVDLCEEEPEEAFWVNSQGTKNVAEATSSVGSNLLYVSTDYIFDGRSRTPFSEEDEPGPVNVYGESKLAGERAVREVMPEGRWVIVRTAWLYGEGGQNFVDYVVEQARAERSLTIVDDQWGNPTWTNEVARAIKVITEAKLFGDYHVASRGVASWYEVAEEVLRLINLEAALEPTSSAVLGRSAARPTYSALDTSKFERDTGITLGPWREALEAYLIERGLAAEGL